MNDTAVKHGISAPIGGFGNHVRWLALLDPVFEFEITPLAEPRFKKIPDPSRRIEFFDQTSKLQSFQTQIYSPNRTWDNWLWMEFLYREELDQFITFDHHGANLHQVEKTLVLTVDPLVALNGYFKLNSNLNHCTPKIFMKQTVAFNNNANNMMPKANSKILAVDCLYQPSLDAQFYQDMIEWFELSDCYELANQVHGLWFAAHQRAEQEFVDYTLKLYQNTTQPC